MRKPALLLSSRLATLRTVALVPSAAATSAASVCAASTAQSGRLEGGPAANLDWIRLNGQGIGISP